MGFESFSKWAGHRNSDSFVSIVHGRCGSSCTPFPAGDEKATSGVKKDEPRVYCREGWYDLLQQALARAEGLPLTTHVIFFLSGTASPFKTVPARVEIQSQQSRYATFHGKKSISRFSRLRKTTMYTSHITLPTCHLYNFVCLTVIYTLAFLFEITYNRDRKWSTIHSQRVKGGS